MALFREVQYQNHTRDLFTWTVPIGCLVQVDGDAEQKELVLKGDSLSQASQAKPTVNLASAKIRLQ